VIDYIARKIVAFKFLNLIIVKHPVDIVLHEVTRDFLLFGYLLQLIIGIEQALDKGVDQPHALYFVENTLLFFR